jgi:hypothetical protein
MNAGAEYVLYRIIGALQDEAGIHPESLLTCLGALAGYACRHVAVDAANRPLTESPMSVWALVRRTVQKLGRPLPNFEARMPRGHRPRRPAVVYLKQLWPQVLPIAQRFCRRPTQLPVLFGIALQRAIEVTRDLLNPTLGARIAMDAAMAMSRVALPGEILQVAAAAPPAVQSVPTATAPSSPAPTPNAAALSDIRADRRRPAADEVTVPNLWTRIASRPAVTLVTIMFLGVMTVAGAKWAVGPGDSPEPARVARKLQVANVQPSAPSLFSEPAASETPAAAQASLFAQPAKPLPPPPPPVAEDSDGPVPTAAEVTEEQINEANQRQLDANATGDSEMLPIVDFVATAPPQPASSIPAESLF